MENDWDLIPYFNEQFKISDIKTYFDTKYDQKKKFLYETYKDNIAEKMLCDYEKELITLRKLYDKRYDLLFKSFKKDLDDNKDKSIIKIVLFGPNDHYSNEEQIILHKAFDIFCANLLKKNYNYIIKHEKELYNDFMDGACTIGYVVLEVVLK